jgi:hypothetical protein
MAASLLQKIALLNYLIYYIFSLFTTRAIAGFIELWPGCLHLQPQLLSVVTRFLAFFLAALMLLQTLGQEVLVVDYQLNKARITALYCINKARPQLHCNGKCHLAKQLRKADDTEKKAPNGAPAKVKYEVLPTQAFAFTAPAAAHWPTLARRYPTPAAAHCAAVPGKGVFRPPLS